ncbi:enoyl-CoA hydratase/carnithine racemase [Nocardia tenerifensis]|uniref:Enoyl-CoA hydratase/carnithine racemase n=1 Tax=Nocardia tenerifensis TaxID=228006 RepID=A0A318JVV9_9NOCA|nr:enoyl-CoA hydratase/isomerase family protein [Nocardia tenerifensis]PXX60359.1 enoyl-CoA hydratase/carnithine racemase [Nocardia tenerifensis]
MIRTDRDGAVLTVWLDNPPYNFLTGEIMTALADLLTSLEGDDSVRAVIFTSAVEDVFVSHYDVAEILEGAQASPITLTRRKAAAALHASRAADRLPGAQAALARAGAGGIADLRRYHEVCRRMRNSDKVFVAALNGRTLGGGCELALSCDIRLMADGPYEIGQPEILVGIIPGGGGTQLLTRVLGAARALELCLEGAPITPARARDIGLVHRLVTPAALQNEAHRTAARLARRSPVAVAALKRAVYEGGSESLDRGMHTERTGFLETSSIETAKRAMARYLEEIREVDRDGRDLATFIADRLPRWIEGSVVEF